MSFDDVNKIKHFRGLIPTYLAHHRAPTISTTITILNLHFHQTVFLENVYFVITASLDSKLIRYQVTNKKGVVCPKHLLRTKLFFQFLHYYDAFSCIHVSEKEIYLE